MIFVSLIVFCLHERLCAQNPSELDLFPSQAGKIDEFFRILDEKKPDSKEAFDFLLSGSPLMKIQDAAKIKDNMVQKTNELWRISSQSWVPERIDAQLIGKDVLIMRYLYKSDVIPVVWYFTFYRSPSKSETVLPSLNPWNCIGVRYDTNLEVFLNNNNLERTKSF